MILFIISILWLNVFPKPMPGSIMILLSSIPISMAFFILKSKKGVLIHINNSRRAVYGYDQRVEVFGSKGMVISNNQTPTSVELFTESSTSSVLKS